MKKLLLQVLLLGILFTSCSKDEDPILDKKETTETRNLEVESFIYRAMDYWYLYEAEIPELQDGHFKTTSEKNDYLASFDSPEDLYKDLQASHDKYSFMTDDYVALSKLLRENVSKINGMDYGLYLFSETSDKIYGWVRYVLPNTSAEEQGIKRGDLFTEIDGQELTTNNYRDLLKDATYQVRISKIVDNTITPTDKVVNLVGTEAAEDPIFITKVFEREGKKIGYLMYNGFSPAFDQQLNDVFGDFKNQNITDLILDLRYNSGGDAMTALDLASMITGQFNDEVLVRFRYNEHIQAEMVKYQPEDLVFKFDSKIRTGEAINSLNLTEVYILTTKGSASASELVINGLKPYIKVMQIGWDTSGKYMGSYTLHDSENFTAKNANPNHTYAIQPLVFKYENKEGVSDFVNGLSPNIRVYEDLGKLGTLGEPSEDLMLRMALNSVLGKEDLAGDFETSAFMKSSEAGAFKLIGESDMFKPNYQRMYIDILPEIPVQEKE